MRMSDMKRTLSIGLEELTRLRITCAKCKGKDTTLELQFDSLKMMVKASCPTCGEVFREQGVDNELSRLAGAIASVKNKNDSYSVEVVLPVID